MAGRPMRRNGSEDTEAADPSTPYDRLFDLSSTEPDAVLSNPVLALMSMEDPDLWQRIWRRARMAQVRKFVKEVPRSMGREELLAAQMDLRSFVGGLDNPEPRDWVRTAILITRDGKYRSPDIFERVANFLDCELDIHARGPVTREMKYAVWKPIADIIASHLPPPRMEFKFTPNRRRRGW